MRWRANESGFGRNGKPELFVRAGGMADTSVAVAEDADAPTSNPATHPPAGVGR